MAKNLENKTLQEVKILSTGVFLGLILVGAIGVYSSEIIKHGSLPKAYESFMKQVDNYPSKMGNPCF